VSTEVWDQAWDRLRGQFDDLGRRLQRLNPGLTWSTGRHANATFPFRAYASFRRDEFEDVVLSVDCAGNDEVVRISADIASRDGTVLASRGPREVLVTPEGVQAEVAEVERFLADEFDLLRRHLVDEPFPGA
jgi:hypothetical protein